MRQIMDMFHRFFNTFISDFQNDRKRCYEITEDFKSIVKPLRRYRNQSADVH